MTIYTVSFFEHREIERPSEVEKNLENLLHDIITQKEYVEFLIGRDGEFDLLASSVIRRIIVKYGSGNASLILVLPYMRANYRDNTANFLNYYDEVEICEESAKAYFKSSIQIRNRSMVDRSNLVICCIQHKSGGAYKTIKYAEKQKCRIINIAENQII